MGNLALLFSILISSSAFALEFGDILLQPLKCWSCTLIEQQENSDYSHMGLYIGHDQVAEAFAGGVKIVSLEEFKQKTDPLRSISVRRLKSLPPYFETRLISEVNLYLGRPYDRWFSWEGSEIYCSELVYKVLAPLVHFEDLSPKPMLFDQNADYWDRYFRGQTPRGELGISPGDFELSSDFETVESI